MPEEDVRKAFVIASIGNHFSIRVDENELNNSEKLNSFLDDGNVTLLSANLEKLEGGGHRIHLDNSLHLGETDDKVLVFFKSKPDVITPENLHTDILLSSMLDSPVSALYHSLHKVYSPILLKDSKWSHEFDPKLQGLITELMQGLGSLMRRRDPKTHKSDDDPGDVIDAMASILTPFDETQYWADLANTAKKKDVRDKAQTFWNALEPISNEFNKIENVQLTEAEEILEICLNALDELWKLEDFMYPQKRMIHLMDIIANAITRYVQSKCSSLDLWKSPFNQVEEYLTQSINLCEQWIDICQKLTSFHWPNYPLHMWEGGSYRPERAVQVQKRLKEVLSLRTLHKQLSQLLSLSEQEELKTEKSFEPFSGLNPVHYNPYTEPLWRAAVGQFESGLDPAENRIAGKLKKQCQNKNGNTLQFLQEFKRYKELIKRPSIQKSLVAERENLLGKLSEYVSSERKNFNSSGPSHQLHGVPKTINNIYFIRQLEAKVKDILKTGELLLSDLSSWPKLASELKEFLDEMTDYQREQFDGWCRDNLQEIESGSLSMKTSSQVVYFAAGKDMKVSYNPRLVGLVREVRMLSIQGFSIPPKILATTDLAKKFARQAKALEQIASFHNTIGDRMITSQRPMMLDAAVSFANLVKEQADMTWDNVDKIQAYIGKLKDHTELLARKNNKLAAYHKEIIAKVIYLMNTDLLRQRNKWKDGVKEIRQIMIRVEEEGFTNLKTWRNHWDRQLYKALEHQYQVGLEALNEHLPEIEIAVTYREQKLQFRPPIEDIRMKYYIQLKRFLAIPNDFKGVSESTENLIFPAIISRNAQRFPRLFQKAEELFQRLEKVKDRFLDWVALGSIDVEDYIVRNFTTAQDWDKNFRAAKSRGQDIGRLPSGDEKIDCISVSYAPVRNEVEHINRKFWDTLEMTLKRSILNDVETIEKFSNEAIENLRKHPQTVAEIGESNQRHAEYRTKIAPMEELMNKSHEKNSILTMWTKDQVDQLNRVATIWDNFNAQMDSYEAVISKQVESIKINLTTQVSNINGEIEKFKLRWDSIKPKEEALDGGSDRIIQGIKTIREKRAEWNLLLESKEKIVEENQHFGLKEPEFPAVDEVAADLDKYEEMWGLFEEFNREMAALSGEEWIIFRSKSYRFEEFLTNWNDKLRASKQTSITVRLIHEIERYKVILPVLKYVRGDIFSEQHWAEMYSLLGMPQKTVETLKFEDFLKVKERLVAQEVQLQELNNRAAGEVAIRQALSELDVWEVEAKFSFVGHQASTGEEVPLIKDWKDILNKVGDNQVLLQSIKGSPYYKSFGDRAVVWENKLADLDEILNNLNVAQRKWVYLEPYQEQMKFKKPAQTGGFDYREVFRKIDDDFRMIMTDAQRDNRIVALLRIGSIKSTLSTMLDRLERCQKSLNEFLEEKRSSFPRFYFIGDDDLLQILGQATKPAIIQTHLKKLFAGIYNVNFDSSNQNIISMNSIEGEVVPLKNSIQISSEVEKWLNELAKEMQNTLKMLLVDCLKDGRDERVEMDPLKYPSQILGLAEAILFTERTEEAIKKGSLNSYLKELKAQLESYTSVDLGGGDDETKVLELKLKALILDTIHYIQVIEGLIESKVRSVEEWSWKKELRFYMGKDNVATVAMVDAQFYYTYEYQGNAPKLVHTPLTDKCYLTLTQAMRVGLGGNPYGPAGTGKTESVKALGGILGRQVLVFNCDEGIDVKSMGRIFIGLIKCGAWGCFDEFNRLEEQTLSAVSMQIQPIQTALRKRAQTVMLMDKEVPLDPNTGIFVTMNPAGKKYGGRQKLPDNLKQLFRPVAMSKPDNEIIGEVSLYSEGFKDAKALGQKLVSIFNLSQRLLSPQQHYDWGLRALKTVLKGCGSMLKMSKKASDSKEKITVHKEAEIIVQALRLNTLSKLTFADSMRFDSLVKDVFTGIAFGDEGYVELKAALQESCIELGYNQNPNQIKKAIELFEQLQQRMGVVIVGPSGSGKTTLFTLLKHAMTKMGKTIKQHTMNPKAIPRTQLLGQIDLDTREWTNGVLTVAALEAVDQPVEVNTWIVCDGDIDPEWIESLNSVLDDNRLLTLPSGWRIQFGPNVNFLFETNDLTYASPATISRMGMIFLSDEDTDTEGILKSWLENQDESNRETLRRLFDEMFFKATDWCFKQNEFIVETSLVGCILNGLSHMDGVSSRLEFGVALLRGLGGNLSEAAKESFAKEVFGWCGGTPHGRRLNCTYYNKDRDKLEPYTSEVDDRLSLANFHLDDYPVVQTAAVKFTLDCVSAWLRPSTQQPFLLVGPEGCGKSLLLNHCFKKLRSTNVAVVHCSAHITPQHVIQKLAQVCLVVSSSNGRVFRPKECDRLILYLKDLNLAMPDKYGTCMLIAFLQQIITYGGFYDGLEWVGLEAVQVVASMSAGSGLGRHQLSTRFTSVVRIASMGQPDKEYLDAFCSSYLGAVLMEVIPSHPLWSNQSKVAQLAASMVSVYIQLKQAFSVDDYNHYIFTTRDLTQWCLSMVRYALNLEDKSPASVLQAWGYEASRLFRDKLATRDDKLKFDTILRNVLMADWNSNIFDSLESVFFVTSGDAGFTAASPLPRFGRNLAPLSPQSWEEFVERGAQIFERENRELRSVMIRELIDLVAHCDRVLSTPGGSLLLSGRSGVGRRTAVSIVSALHQAKLVSLRMGKNFGVKQFKSELKAAMQSAAIEDGQIFLLLEDHNFTDPQFLDMVNSLLSSGEIPGLYSPEELEPFLAPLRERASNEGYSGNLISFFAQSVLKNLHVILIMDCSSVAFRERCESNPALFKKCAIQWMEFWSDDTMIKFPEMLLSHEPRMEGEDIGGDKKSKSKHRKENVESGEFLQHFQQIHTTLSPEKTSTHKFVTFIQTYKGILSKKRESVLTRQKKLSKGVSKLQEAKEVVHRLKSEAAVQEKELAEKQSEANDALQMITDTMRNANTQKGQMEELRGKTLQEEKDLNKRKKAIEIEMAEIQPLVEEAKQAVGNIKSNTLSEIRSLRAPPDVIRDVLEGVLCLMGTQDTSWNSMKSFLAKRGVKEEILSFDARRISHDSRVTVERLLQQRSNSFDPNVAKKASAAAAPLAIWVVANVKFSYVLEKVKPLEAEQMKLQRNLKMAEDQIGQLSSGLDEVDQQVSVLKDRLNKFTKEAAEIEIHLSKTKETIVAADSLVVGLEGEYKRWNSEVKSMEKDLEKIPHFSLLAAAFVTYLSAAPEDTRRKAMEQWASMLGLKQFELKRFLSSEREMLQWRSEGLPSDDLSIENAMCIIQSKPSPFLIDPSSRAVEWLKAHLSTGDKPIEVANPKDDRFILTLELAVRFGKTLILQDVNSVDPILFPLLRGDLSGQGVYKVVQIGEKMVDFNPAFRMFLATRDTSIEIPPDAASIISSVNFTTTRAGMTSQLLATALKHEKPELELRKSELLRVEEDHKMEIGRLEDFLLEELANATGNLLENKELLASLNETKSKSASISASLKESVALQESIAREGNVYLPVATFASDLYFTIADLTKLNNMYRISLSAFMGLFQKSLQKASYGGTSSDKRINALKSTLQDLVYEYISRGLFKSDRLTFAMHLAHGMYPDMFKENEWEAFTGILVATDVGDGGASIPKWIPDERRLDLVKFKSLFPKVYETLQLDSQSVWQGFLTSDENTLPYEVVKKTSPFLQVLLFQAIKPERLVSSMEDFAGKVLSLKELSPPALSLKNVLRETQASEPVLIIISSGSDPSEELRDLAQKTQQVLHEVAMGQGQTEVALEKLHLAAEKGEWLCLKNLHLMTFWLPALEKEFQSMNCNENFRLWLTAEPHPKFSPTLAESCLKVTYESPPGVKRNLQRTLQAWSSDVFGSGENPLRARTVFALAWFHAVVQERRIFIPQGWCKFYEFSDSDLKAGLQVIDQLLSRETSNIDWEFIHGLFANAIYGGRVDDIYDIQILQSYLLDMFHPDVISSGKRPLGPIPLPGASAGFKEFNELVNQLPEEDKPSMFGLPANIQQAYQRSSSSATLQQLRILMRSVEGAAKFEREKWSTELTPILSLWKKLNQSSGLIQYKLGQVSRGSRPSEPKDPVAAFIELEFSNGVTLIQVVHKSLSGLTKVIRGTALVDEKVSRLADNLMKQTTPASWQKMWEGPEEPVEYIKTIVAKANAVQNWKSSADNGAILQRELDLADLFNPDTFLGALRQQTARDHGVSMDELKFSNAWSRSTVASAKIPIKVMGLLIEGATFDGVKLSESTSQSPTLSQVPVGTFAWILKSNPDHYQPGDCVRLPVYHTDQREKILTFVDVPCSGDKKKWLQAGTVLFLKSQF